MHIYIYLLVVAAILSCCCCLYKLRCRIQDQDEPAEEFNKLEEPPATFQEVELNKLDESEPPVRFLAGFAPGLKDDLKRSPPMRTSSQGQVQIVPDAVITDSLDMVFEEGEGEEI